MDKNTVYMIQCPKTSGNVVKSVLWKRFLGEMIVELEVGSVPFVKPTGHHTTPIVIRKKHQM